jgi:hypothetical protein
MISYDDLVAALQAWRARQGLPVEQQTAGTTSGSGPRSVAPPPPAPRTNPPAPPPMGARAPMPLAAPEETHEDLGDLQEHEIEEHAIDEAHYENEGDDFAMSFGQDGHNGHVSGVDGPDGAETMLGHDPNVEPDRPSELTDPAAAQRNGRDDW